MQFEKVTISNLDDYFHYVQEKKSMKAEISDVSAHTMIFDKLKVTLELNELTPIEILSLKKWCSKLILKDFHFCERKNLETYQLAEDYLDTLDDMKNFIAYIEKDEDLKTDWLYDVLINCRFQAVCVLNLDTVNFLIDFKTDSIFETENRLMSEQEYVKNKDSILEKFISLFASKFMKALPMELNRYDIPVENALEKEYFLSELDPEVKLVKCVSPFGGCFNFTKTDGDVDTKIAEFSEMVKLSREYGMDDEITLYFGVSSTFYTMFNFITYCGFDADYDLKNDFVLGNRLYLDDILLEKYQNRMDTYLGPILQEKIYSVSNKEDNVAFSTLLAPANTLLRYCLKVKLSDIERIKMIDEFDIGGDFEVIWEEVKKSLHIVDATTKN